MLQKLALYADVNKKEGGGNKISITPTLRQITIKYILKTGEHAYFIYF